jgi:hypothetical protein
MPDAAYFRAYRAANRERLLAQQRERRRLKPRDRGDRHEEYARRHARLSCGRQAALEIPSSYVGHDVFVRAVKIVGPPCHYEREVWEDEMGTVVVALLERRGDTGARRALVALRSSRVAARASEYSLEASQEWTEQRSRA